MPRGRKSVASRPPSLPGDWCGRNTASGRDMACNQQSKCGTAHLLLVRRPFITLVTGSFSGTICAVGGSGWGRLVLMKRTTMWVADVWSGSTGTQGKRLGHADRNWSCPAYGREAGTTKNDREGKVTFSVTTGPRCEGN